MTDRMLAGRTVPALRVGFLLARHFTLSALALFVDTLRLAADDGDCSRPLRCAWSILSATGLPIRSSCGVLVYPTAGLPAATEFDYIVLVGGLLRRGPSLDAVSIAWLRAAGRTPTPLIGLCTGGLLLCREGLMDGRACCVSWFHHADFQAEFPHLKMIADRLFVVDRNRITCSGGSGAADLAAFLIERHLGAAVARKCRDILLLGQARPPEAAQPHPAMALACDEPRVRRALLMMEQTLATPLSIAAIAAALDLSRRQLERLFHAALRIHPGAAYRQLRLRRAHWLLAHTGSNVTQAALAAGFTDASHFARQFRAAYGAAPAELRRRPSSLAADAHRHPRPDVAF